MNEINPVHFAEIGKASHINLLIQVDKKIECRMIKFFEQPLDLRGISMCHYQTSYAHKVVKMFLIYDDADKQLKIRETGKNGYEWFKVQN